MQNQLFDTTILECRPSNMVDCGLREGVNLGRTNACVGQRNGRLVENPHNCRSYFECNSGQASERDCEFGYLYDVEIEACEEAHLVRCGRRIIPSDDYMDPEDFFPSCPINGITYRPHPQDCAGYIACNEGVLSQRFCPRGNHFNPRTLECDKPENAQCLTSRVVVPQTPILPDCSGEERYFPDLVNCQRYFECEDQEPKQRTCPIGRMWDHSAQKCAIMNANLCQRNFSLK